MMVLTEDTTIPALAPETTISQHRPADFMFRALDNELCQI